MTTTAPEGAPASRAAATALTVSGLDAGYGRTKVLRDVSLDVAPGAVTALVGPNGAGKTTLLKAISGLLPAQSGQIRLFGQDIGRLDPYRRATLGLCHIPEGRAVYRSLTVRENLQMQAERGRQTQAIERAVEAFPVLGRRLAQTAGTLSGGEQQMLAIAAAYVRDVRLIVVDEPSLGLSPIMVDTIYQFLESLSARGTALLLIDQYVTRALSMAHEAYIMRRGQIVYRGDPHALLADDLFEHYIGSQREADVP